MTWSSTGMKQSNEHRPAIRRNAAYRRGLLVGALTILASLAPASNRAQGTDWPSKAVTVVVGLSAGGSTDLMARIASKKLSEDLNQTFVVENRVGGGGIVAASHVARAAPDGYTLFFAASPHIAVVPKIQTVNYDPIADFAPVSAFSTGPFILAINSSIPAKTFAEFVKYAKTNKLNYGSSGVGSISHLSSALLLSRADLEGSTCHSAGAIRSWRRCSAGRSTCISPLRRTSCRTPTAASCGFLVSPPSSG